MKQQSHTLTNRLIDENGLVDKYEEFNNSSFDNEFVPLESQIIASVNKLNFEEEDMKGTRKASYVGELSSGYDAKVQDDYEAGKGATGQAGKGHTEEVAKKNNWNDDKRDAVGKAAAISSALKKAAASLAKIADAMDAYADDVDEDEEQFDDFDLDIDEEEELEKEASHPIEHDVKKDDPEANMSSDTGDEWIDIGPGSFDDERDEANRAE